MHDGVHGELEEAMVHERGAHLSSLAVAKVQVKRVTSMYVYVLN